MSGRSNARRVGYTDRWYEKQPRSRLASALSRRAYWIVKAAADWTTGLPVSVRVTHHPQHQGDGSSWTVRGVMAFHSWCVTGLCSLDWPARRLVTYGLISPHDRSANGPDGSKTSASSKSWNAEESIIGTAAATHAEGEG